MFYKLLVPIVIFVIVAIWNTEPFILYPSIVIIVILSLYLINIIITPITFNLLSTRAFFKSKDDIYFIGSSKIFTTFNPKIIQEYTNNLSVYSFGNNAQDFTFSAYLTQEFIKKHKPKIIIMESFFIFNTYRPSNSIYKSCYQGTLTALNHKQRKGLSLLYNENTSFICVLKDILSFKKLSLLNFKILISNKKHLDIRKGFLLLTKRRTGDNFTFVPQDAQIKNITPTARKIISNRYKREVLELLTVAKKYNIKVLFVDTPMYSEDHSLENTCCEISNSLGDLHDDVKVINFNNHMGDLHITPDHFDDYIHLLDTGSTIISHKMGEILKEYITSQSVD